MNGKILKIANNDLYGNVDDRRVVVFAVFTHKKYMNKYAIFSFEGEYNKHKLYLASVHLKENSLVVFNIKPNEEEYIDAFINDYLENKVNGNEYEIINIDNINKIELVAYYEKEFDKLSELDSLSIKRIVTENTESSSKKKYGFLYFVLFLLVLLLAGITYLYFNPDIFDVELKTLNCTKNGYDKKVELNYTSEAELRFDQNDKIKYFHKFDTYVFPNENKYYDFKFTGNESEVFNVEGAYKYDDDKLELKLIYDEKIVIDQYDEIFKYLKSNGYECIEGTYNE